jgi:Oxidoreductase NAD-binding domain
MTASIQANPGARSWSGGSYRPRRPAGSGRAAGISRHERRQGGSRHRPIAGGVGIAPAMSMLETLADRGAARPVVLFAGNRNWDCIIFAAIQN